MRPTDAVSALVKVTPPAGGEARWWRFRDPVEVVTAERLEAVLPALAAVEAAVERGLHAVGFICYEAAPAFDPALAAHPPGPWPLAWWALYRRPEESGAPRGPAMPALDWRPLMERAAYDDAIRRIRAAIAAGHTYQVNLTFPLEAAYEGEAFALFAALCQWQRPPYAAYLDAGRFAVCSASPELFFALDGERIVTRPMKGTARRGRTLDEDRPRAAELAASAKDRAENVMIVDMMRNDLGRIAEPGSVRVDELCRVETYPTVHQLTSTVSAATHASLVEILRALFPSASITGAPKISTARIIRELEAAPRGVYTGTVGYLAPGRRAQLNVAIRTAAVDRAQRRVRYGTGGGIVWDSDAASEYEECRTKALVLRAATREFELLETLLWRPRRGYFLLARHLERLAASAEYFGIAWRGDDVRRCLDEARRGETRQRVRLLLDGDGRPRVETHPLPPEPRKVWTVALDDRPIDASDVLRFHKTSFRKVYDDVLARHPGADDVLLWNERGELAEATRANLVLRRGRDYLTPPLACGLLAGTYRAELLARGRLREEVLSVDVLDHADEVWLINSVRGWVRARLSVDPRGPGSARIVGSGSSDPADLVPPRPVPDGSGAR